ncbi:MAG: hypothetical protein AB1Z19_05605 [Eubacteriales bacterium]
MYNYDKDEPLSVIGWIGTILLLMIPIVGMVMIFVWGLGEGNQSRKNFAIASLIVSLLLFALFIVAMIFNGDIIMTVFNQIKGLTPY